VTSEINVGTGGSLASDGSLDDPTTDGKSLIELIIRQARTSAPNRQTWLVGTAGRELRGRLWRYARHEATGEVSIIMETNDGDPSGSLSATIVPLNQITYLKHLP
jgi:hypothetical protein